MPIDSRSACFFFLAPPPSCHQWHRSAGSQPRRKERPPGRGLTRSRRRNGRSPAACNAPDSMCQVSASYSPSLPCHLLACCTLPRHHLHFIMSSCAFHFAYMFVSCIRAFPRCPFCNPALLCPPASPSSLFSCAGIKLSRNGPRFAKRPGYSTDRPPVKFHAIWRSFGTPTVNRVTVKPSLKLQPNTPSKVAQNPYNSPPCSRSFDHDRVGENRSSFGHS